MSNSTVPLGWGRYWSSISMCHPNTTNSPRCSALLGRTFSLAYPVNACWCSTEHLKCRLSHWTTHFPTVRDIHYPLSDVFICIPMDARQQQIGEEGTLWPNTPDPNLSSVTDIPVTSGKSHFSSGSFRFFICKKGIIMQDCDSLSEIFGIICILKFKFLWGGGELTFSERYFSGNTHYATPSAGSRTALWNQTHKYPRSKIYEYSH